MNLQPLAKLLIVAGGALVLLGVVLYLAPNVPILGKLPGDIRIERELLNFYFPFTTCIVLSIVISLLLMLFSRLR